ncbi:hypothetical protein [Streptomyces sp. Isolate_45]|uniref:hypothetical protein n=1 Tax=Streptomyces sp. Isolate_45 TaxID=2950111 RepID=UPI002481CE26|nr:hypothetical protein [Streptomyces sp. Isolate_45]MDA5281698.1 hypothetical protein [Streptomyces sp. Isolate_45]
MLGGDDERDVLGEADGDAERDALGDADREADADGLGVGLDASCEGPVGSTGTTLAAGADGFWSVSALSSAPEPVNPRATATAPATTSAPAPASRGSSRRDRLPVSRSAPPTTCACWAACPACAGTARSWTV